MSNFLQQLEDGLNQDLPGSSAQFEMATLNRQSLVPPAPDAREAGVMALFYQKKEVWHLVFIKRTSSHPNDRHGGQISFPGGKREATDADLSITALREVEEEIGVPQQDIEVLGALSQLYIPVSNFLVYPHVGVVRSGRPTFIPQPSEVAGILEIPFATFLDDAKRKKTNIKISEQLTLKNVPYFDVGNEQVLWGATAMIMSELVAVAKKLA